MNEYSRATLAGDADRFLALWDEDAVQMPQADGMVVGKQDLGVFWRLSFKTATYEVFDIEITDAHAEQHLGVVYGNFKWVIRFKSGVRESRNGKYLTVLKREPDGSWKIALDCSNMNN